MSARLCLSWCLVLSLGMSLLGSAPAAADEPTPRLVVLQRDARDVSAAQRAEVDELLLRGLAARSFASTFASQVPLEEVELAAGCSAREADCMQRLASALGADWLLIRELSRDASGGSFLTLVAHDGPSAVVTRRAAARLASGDAAPAVMVPLLLERLYPQPAPIAAIATPGPAPHAHSAASVLGWSAAGAGATLLIAGTAMGVLSHRDHRAYERSEMQSQAAVDRAEDRLSRAQQRARVANGLLIGGAVAGVAGAATLLWTYLRPSEEDGGVHVGLSPVAAGAAFSLAGAWRGGL